MSMRVPTGVQINAYSESYVLYGDRTRAFRVAFPNSKASNKNLHTSAAKFHCLPQVCTWIDELQKILKKQSEKEFTLSVSELKKYLKSAITKGLAGKEMVLSGGEKVNGGPVSISGAVSAIAEVNKMDGNYAATRIALGGDKDAPPIVVANIPIDPADASKMYQKMIDGK